MLSESDAKQWRPDRFTLSKTNNRSGFMIIISNQPLENVALLLKLCSEGN